MFILFPMTEFVENNAYYIYYERLNNHEDIRKNKDVVLIN